MADSFDPKRLERLIATLDEVCAEARVVRDEVRTALARTRDRHHAHDRPAGSPRRKAERKRRT